MTLLKRSSPQDNYLIVKEFEWNVVSEAMSGWQ
jgi:hypothetical protein